MSTHASLLLGLELTLTLAMLVVIVSDAMRYVIPNSLNGALLLLTGACMFYLPFDVLWALAAAGIALAVGLGLFSLGFMGGGDVKLLAILILWTGWGAATLNFLFLTAIAGGALVILILLMRLFLAPLWLSLFKAKPVPRLLTRKEPVPYGLAIAFGFLWLLWTGGIPVLH